MSRCMFCGNNMRHCRAVKCGEKILICCEWCEMLLTYHGLCTALAQCMDCGVILDSSPFRGRIFRSTDGKPDLNVGHSHGICEPCARVKLDEWRRQRALRKTRQEDLAANVLQTV